MDYNFGLGITPYMPTNNMWASPYAMNPMMYNPMFQLPQIPQAPQFSLPEQPAKEGPTVEAAKDIEAQQKASEFKVHDIANAGDAVPLTMQSVEKRTKLYRRSDKFGDLITEQYKGAERGLDRRIAVLDNRRVALKALEQRLADAKAAKDATLVKELEKTLATEQKRFDLSAKYLQKDLLKARLGDLKNAKLEKQFLTKYMSLTQKGAKGEKALAKLMANPKYSNQAAKLSRQLNDIKSLQGVSKLSVRDTMGVLQGNLNKASSELELLQNGVKGLKSTGAAAKWAGRAGWAIAIGLEGYEVYQVADKHGWASKQTAKKATGATAGLAGAWGGAKGGAALGAAIGAWFGGVGAPIGGVIGGLIGGAIGYFAAQKVSDVAFDATMGKTEYKA